MNKNDSPKLSRKEREYLRHKEEILWAAEEVFSEKGYVSATVDEIAQRAEFAVGTLYRFFENKSDLYSETVLTRMRMMEEKIYTTLQVGDSPAEAVKSYFGSRIELFWEYPRFFRLFFSGPVGTISDANLGFLPEILERYERLLGEIRRLLSEGVRRGEFRKYSPDLLTLTMEGLLKAYVEKRSREDNPVRDEEEEELLFQIFLSG
ncbi:MAG: TetR/AcrR family transcriptional regulator, partial [bacterium]